MKLIYTPADFPSPVTTPVPENFPQEHIDRPVCIFLDLEGVMMNFTERAAFALDQLDVPISSSGLISPNPIYSFTTDEVFHDVCHGFDFYADAPVYPWADLIFERCFQLTHENVYFLSYQSKWDREAWGGCSHFVWRNFGSYGYNRLIMVTDEFSLINVPFVNLTPRCILLSTKLDRVQRWCQGGGSAMHWVEIDHRADVELVSRILIERFKVLWKYIAEIQR